MGISRREAMGALGALGAVAGGGCLGLDPGPPRTAITVTAIANDGEYCLLPRDLGEEIGATKGRQVRVGRPEDRTCALFTVAGTGSALVVTEAGRERLRLEAGARVAVEASVETPADAPYAGTFEESVREGDGDLLACAPHGGDVEPGTDDQAVRLAESTGAAAWICRGDWPDGGAFDRWHVASTDVHPDSFPGLGRVASATRRFAVAFHGSDADGVAVGGGAPEALRERVRDAIDEAVPASVSLAEDPGYRGDDLGNVVNWVAQRGIQIEQGIAAREDHGAAIADAVSATLPP